MRKLALRLSTAVAAIGVACTLVATVGAATAGATTDDERFLGVVADLEIQFSSPQQAVQIGRDVCQGVAAGVEQGVDPADIRAGLINGLKSQGLDNSQAANLFWAAVDIYCPQYNDIAGD